MTQHTTIDALAGELLEGRLPESQAWDVAAVVDVIVDTIGNRTVAQIQVALRTLVGQRHYDPARRVAEAWTARQGFDPTVTKHHAQALINMGALDDAERLLSNGLATAGVETLEYGGLLARVQKQRFVVTSSQSALMAATDRYLGQYLAAAHFPDSFWQGINAVALRAREERDGLYRPTLPPSQELAARVEQQAKKLLETQAGNAWIAATLSEAALALGECDRAELWLCRFLNHRNISPFAVESYARQIREIWQGDPIGGGQSCADRLAASLARYQARTEARLVLSPSEVDRLRASPHDLSELEKNFSGEATFSRDTLRRMVDACPSIAAVCDTRGSRLGTGFLVPGEELGLGTGSVFVTNAHVLSETAAGAVRPPDARISFEVESEAKGTPVHHRIEQILFSSPPGEIGRRSPTNDALDVTVCRLESLPAQVLPLKATTGLPLVEAKARVYVVGHPRGGGLQIALHDSRLLDVDDDERLLHYRTPTDPGSSGSPVFNAAWEVIGLHHAGSSTMPRLHGTGTYEANEAIALGAIARKLRP